MLKTTRSLALACALLAAGLTLHPAPGVAREFTFNERVNEEMAKKLAIPVYFALPNSARLPISRSIATTDRLIDFRHPDAIRSGSRVGLRLIVGKREGLAQRLAKSGLVQTGDLLLTFRPEWGGVGAYPNLQMGISHTGVAYVKDGTVHNIDNPLDEEFIGAGKLTELNSEFYESINLIHVVRPRGFTDWQRANLVAWATRLNAAAKDAFPSRIGFNLDYNDPKYRPGKPLTFVRHVGRIALGQSAPEKVDMFCSEFAWSLLALRNCDPDENLNAFAGNGMPTCVTPIMRPMRATGDYMTRKAPNAYTGLADGPLLVISSLRLSPERRDRMLQSVFVADPEGMSKMSEGHREIAQAMQEKFATLETYYRSAASGAWLGLKAKMIGGAISRAIPENYSPASFLINTLLPPANAYRTMDYVATILIE